MHSSNAFESLLHPKSHGTTLDLRQSCVIERVLCDDVPAYSLFESTSKEFIDTLNIGRCHVLRFAVSVLKNRAFRPLQCCNKPIRCDGSYVLHQCVAKQRGNIVADQPRIGFIGAGTPFFTPYKLTKSSRKAETVVLLGDIKVRLPCLYSISALRCFASAPVLKDSHFCFFSPHSLK